MCVFLLNKVMIDYNECSILFCQRVILVHDCMLAIRYLITVISLSFGMENPYNIC